MSLSLLLVFLCPRRCSTRPVEPCGGLRAPLPASSLLRARRRSAHAPPLPFSAPLTRTPVRRLQGYRLLDVRPAEEFDAFHVPGSVSVPLFAPIKIDSVQKALKQLLYAANGMKGTDENVNFVQEVLAVLPSSKLLVMCDSGGSYEAKVGNVEGRRSRSLVAIYKLLVDGGCSDLLHVEGGARAWGEKGLEFSGTNPEGWTEKAGAMPPSS